MENKIQYPENIYPFQSDSYKIIGICMEVHRTLGPRLSEVLYKDAIEIDLIDNHIQFEREKKYEVVYKGILLPHHFYADFVIDNKIILEVKSVKAILDEHYAYMINYLALSNCPLGLIVNFGPGSLEIKRVII